MFRLTNLTRVAALGAVVALAACESHKDVLGPNPLPTGALFQSYVALGNSITAGWQSGGIYDATQRQSYAFLLAQQMGTQYHYAALAAPGCPAPIVNAQTGARLGAPNNPPCALRIATSVTDVLNNVAVPDARVLDPISVSTVASNALTTLILGGQTQVQRALVARPTFATIWIGNNDVLAAGVTGLLTPFPAVPTPQQPIISPGIVSTQAQFQASYDAMIKQLTDSMPALKGVLIGVVQIPSVAVLSPGAAIFAANAASAAFRGALAAGAGGAVVVNPNCNGSASLVNLPLLLGAMRAGSQPRTISCVKGSDPANPLVGDIFVLDPAEQSTLSAVIKGYDDYIQAKATASGFAYYDPNVLLAAQRQAGNVPALPDFASTTAPFGALFSIDGVHPSGAGQRLIANDLIAVINTKYSTTLQPVP
jgi:hypothetical protein